MQARDSPPHSYPPHAAGAPGSRSGAFSPGVKSDLPEQGHTWALAGGGGWAPTAGNIWFELSVGSPGQAAKEFAS